VKSPAFHKTFTGTKAGYELLEFVERPATLRAFDLRLEGDKKCLNLTSSAGF